MAGIAVRNWLCLARHPCAPSRPKSLMSGAIVRLARQKASHHSTGLAAGTGQLQDPRAISASDFLLPRSQQPSHGSTEPQGHSREIRRPLPGPLRDPWGANKRKKGGRRKTTTCGGTHRVIKLSNRIRIGGTGRRPSQYYIHYVIYRESYVIYNSSCIIHIFSTYSITYHIYYILNNI